MCSRGSNAPLVVWLLGVEIASAEIEGVSGTRVVLQRGFLAPWKVRKWNAGENLILVTRLCGIVAEPINLSSVLFNEGLAGVLTEPLREPIPFENARPRDTVRIQIETEGIEKMRVSKWEEWDV